MRWIARVAIFLLLAPAAAGQDPDAARGKLVFRSSLGPLDVFTYRATPADGPLVIVCHGMLRNADEYRDKAVRLADRLHAVVATPCFDEQRFPNEAYQQGGILKSGAPQPAEQWTVSVIDKLAHQLRARDGESPRPFYLIGHSAGAQFLGRLAAFCPSDARRIVLANPGSYVFPTRELPYPYGLGGLPETLSGDEAIKRYLARPVTLYLGTADVENENLPSGPHAMQQGATRYERGKNAFRLASTLARERGWAFHWRLVEAQGVAHDAQAMFDHPQARVALLGE